MGTVFGQSTAIMFKVLFLCLLGAVYGGVPTCNTVWEEKCWDEPRQQCKAVQKPFTTTQYEQECTSIQVPKVDRVPEQKCRSVTQSTSRSAQPGMRRNARPNTPRSATPPRRRCATLFLRPRWTT